MTDKAHRFTDGIGTGSTGSDSRHCRSAAVVADCDHTGCHIADHHRYEERRYTAGTSLHQLGVFCLKRPDTTDSRAKNDRKTFGFNGALDTAFLHRLPGCRDGKLRIAVGAQHIIYL